MQHERRLHPRAVVRLAAEIRRDVDPAWTTVLLYDLSGGGAGIHCATPLAVQSEVALRFAIPTAPQSKLQVSCLVVRRGAASPADADRPHLAGLHFLDLHGSSFDHVRAYVWSLLHPQAD